MRDVQSLLGANSMTRLKIRFHLFVLIGVGLTSQAFAQSVPGFNVSEYAQVTDPMRLAFDNSGIHI